jgi:hypothetical protein
MQSIADLLNGDGGGDDNGGDGAVGPPVGGGDPSSAGPTYTQSPPAGPTYPQSPPAGPAYTQSPPAGQTYTQSPPPDDNQTPAAGGAAAPSAPASVPSTPPVSTPSAPGAVDVLMQDIDNYFDNTVTQFHDNSAQFNDDVKHARDVFLSLEKDTLKDALQNGMPASDLHAETLRNIFYATVSGGSDALVTRTLPKTGDPVEDTWPDLWKMFHHSLEHPPTLSGAWDRVKEFAHDYAPDLMSKVDYLGDLIKNFRATP